MEKYLTIFIVVWFFLGIIPLYIFISGSKKAKKMFEGISLSEIVYQEKGASGYSKKSFFTRIGGARNALEVIVTETELCLKGIMAAFTFIGTKYDLTHRVPLSNIVSAAKKGKSVELQLITSKGATSNIVLRLRNPDQFLQAVHSR